MVVRFIGEQHPDSRRYPIYLLTDQDTVVNDLPAGVRQPKLLYRKLHRSMDPRHTGQRSRSSWAPASHTRFYQ
jgi:hypothetical protein